MWEEVTGTVRVIILVSKTVERFRNNHPLFKNEM